MPSRTGPPRVGIRLRPQLARDTIEFSSGPPFEPASGIRVTAGPTPVPVFLLDAGAGRVLVQTGVAAGGSGNLAFQVSLSLAASPGLAAFYLRSEGDPGIQVTAALGAGPAQAVNATDTLFRWTAG